MAVSIIHKLPEGLAIALVLLAAVACTREDYALQDKELSGRMVNFSAVMCPDGTGTKGQIPTDNKNLFTMGVFAGYEEEEESFGPSSSANDFIDNVRYTRSFITNPFAGADVCYWPFNGKLSFFAYAPYISSTFLQFASDYVSGYPRMTYSPTTNVTDQPDFCLATPVLDRHSSGEPIPLVFHHSLSQVVFSANYAGDFPAIITSSPLYVKVDNIRICNVIGKKTVTMSSGTPCFDWQDDAECPDGDRVSYLLDRSLNHQLNDIELPKATDPVSDNYMELTTVDGVANGVMYLLPQTMDKGEVYLELTYGYYEMVDTKETLRASARTSCPLPAVDWEPTKSYRYRFTINLAANSIVNPSIMVETWKDVNNTESNLAHIE